MAAAFALAGAAPALLGQINTFNGKWTEEPGWIFGETYRVYDTRPVLTPNLYRIRGPFSEMIRTVFTVYSREYWEVDPIIAPGSPPTVHTDDRWGAEPRVWSRGLVADSNTDVFVFEGQSIRLPLAPFAATAGSLTIVNSGTQTVTLNGGVLNLTPFAINESLRVGVASTLNYARATTLILDSVTLTSASIAMIGVGLPAGAGGSLEGKMVLSPLSQWFHPAGLIEIGGGDGIGHLVIGYGSLLAGSSQPGAQTDPRVVVNAGSTFDLGLEASARLSELSVNSILTQWRASELRNGNFELTAGLYVDSGSLKTDRLILGETATAKALFYHVSTSSLGVITVDKNSRLELNRATVDAASLDVTQGSVSVEVEANFTIGDPNSPAGATQLLKVAPSAGSSSGLTVKGPTSGPVSGGLLTVHGSALLGGYGAATIDIQRNSVLDIRGTATLGQGESSEGGAAGSGTVNVDGGTLRAQEFEIGYSYFANYGPEWPVPTGILKVGSRVEVAGSSQTFNFGPAPLTFHYGGYMRLGTGGTLDFTAAGGKVLFLDPSNGASLQNSLSLTNYGLITGGDSTGTAPTGRGHIDFGDRGGAVTNRGTIAPGHSAGWLAITGDLRLESTSNLLLELGGATRGSGYDALTVTGALTAGGTLTVSLINGFVPSSVFSFLTLTSGSSFDLFDFGSISGTFATVNLPVGYDWNTDALYTTGVISLGAVPEPSTYALGAGLGALGIAVGRRRRVG